MQFSSLNNYPVSPLPDFLSETYKKTEILSSEESKCNPCPSFPLPKKETPKQGFIPSNLLRQVQEMRIRTEDSEAFLSGQDSEKISEEMRHQRKEIYFPNKDKK